jgi:hypothetical protein
MPCAGLVGGVTAVLLPSIMPDPPGAPRLLPSLARARPALPACARAGGVGLASLGRGSQDWDGLGVRWGRAPRALPSRERQAMRGERPRRGGGRAASWTDSRAPRTHFSLSIDRRAGVQRPEPPELLGQSPVAELPPTLPEPPPDCDPPASSSVKPREQRPPGRGHSALVGSKSCPSK